MNNNAALILSLIIVGLVRTASIAIGAWLVVRGHPWFGLLAMLFALTATYSGKLDQSEQDETGNETD